jgi:glycosyltransferase involved in cell wall biosynthesis
LTAAPRVTLVVAMRNEADAIRACLESIARQAFPADRLEVLIYDGGSTDDSRAIAGEIARPRAGWAVLPNVAGIQAAAWNAGIERATGQVIGIVSGHAELAPDYVERAVEALARTGADMVGGPVRAEGRGRIGRAVAAATSSRFGIGDAAHHYATSEREVDSVFMGVCRAETYRRFRFDERLVRDQDDELSYRLRKAGGRIVCDPAIRSRYHSRTTLGGLARQYFAYGYWKVEVLRRHPAQMRPRQFVPSLLVASGIAGGLAVLAPVGWGPLSALAGVYLGAALAAAILARGDLPPAVRLALPLVFATMHLAYGSGFLVGLLRLALGRAP